MTEHEKTEWELEWFLLFCVCVANKKEAHGRRVADGLCFSPFGSVRVLLKSGDLERQLRQLRSGQYRRITRALAELTARPLDLRTCTVADLQCIHGIGPKTARYFILKTRPDARVAALDTHILKWLRTIRYDAPRATPTGATYLRWEGVFLEEADKRGLSSSELDHRIWMHYAKGEGELP